MANKSYSEQGADNKITTYKERSLHSSLKAYFCPDESMHEIKIGRFFADACDGTKIFEIQTGSLGPLEKKIKFYLENTELDIVIVHPIAKNRKIYWLDGEGELQGTPKLSSSHKSLADGISNLYYLRNYIGNPRVSFCFVLMEIDEVRLLDGYGKNKKIRATSVDRVAGEIYSVHYVRSVTDVREIILPLLPSSPFTREELSRSLKLDKMHLWSAQKLLCELEIVSCERDGKRLLFQKLV